MSLSKKASDRIEIVVVVFVVLLIVSAIVWFTYWGIREGNRAGEQSRQVEEILGPERAYLMYKQCDLHFVTRNASIVYDANNNKYYAVIYDPASSDQKRVDQVAEIVIVTWGVRRGSLTQTEKSPMRMEKERG